MDAGTGTGQQIGDEPDHASAHIANPVSSFGTSQDAADALSIPLTSVARLADIEADIAVVAAPPTSEHPEFPHLNYGPITESPEPWNDAHFEPDSRRAQAADLPLDRPTRELCAELGLDEVTELLREQQTNDIDRLQEWRGRFIDIAQGQASAARDVDREAERVAEADAERTRARKAEKQALYAQNRHIGPIPPHDPNV